jgi:hypothetical protein
MDYYYEHTATLPLGGLKSVIAQGSVKKGKTPSYLAAAETRWQALQGFCRASAHGCRVALVKNVHFVNI